MSNGHQSSAPEVLVENFPVVQNPDRSVTRLDQFPTVAAAPHPDSSSSAVLSKDVPLNPQHKTWLRLYLPRKALDTTPSSKLPLIVYFHGGGFILFSAATKFNHDFCFEIPEKIGAVLVSVDYRLAPEHRLPAAYDDAMEALHWIRTSRDQWVHGFADLSSCFLLGSSAGGNIVYHAGLRAATAADDLLPVKIKGLVLHQPGFSGSQRTASELKLANNSMLPLVVVDFMCRLALPIGADRDHEYCNPMVGSESVNSSLEQIKRLGWRVMVTDCEGDPFFDRAKELSELLEKKGVRVLTQFDEGGYHGVELADPTRLTNFLASLQNFLSLEG